MLFKINNVGFEAETGMRFGPGALELMVAREGKDVIANHIGLAVMLMEAAVRGAVNQIAFCHDAAAAFVKVNAPAAIANGSNIMPKVVENPCARLLS